MSVQPVLVVGLGVAGTAVARQLAIRGCPVVAVDDSTDPAIAARAAEIGVDLVQRPTEAHLAELAESASAIAPSPGLPHHHPVFAVRPDGVPLVSEFDFAGEWDQRPILAVTGTDGKTTVTRLVVSMLDHSGVTSVAAGNTDLPLVDAIDDPEVEVFVVEASSFQLGNSRKFVPYVATWLNFAPDHLDVHRSLEEYEEAKASIWRYQGPDDVAVVNLDDPVVTAHRPELPRVVTFDTAGRGDLTERDGMLIVHGEVLLPVADLPRALPHDRSNALAAAATALNGGASVEGVRAALRDHVAPAHRVERVGEIDGVVWYDDSKATTPHAVVAAVGGFESVVLIAGGRNKGLDLTPLAAVAGRIRAVIAIGEAAEEIAAVFADGPPVEVADSMADAVGRAERLAEAGDAVLLSPACASFDWYASYGARGDDFAREVAALEGGTR